MVEGYSQNSDFLNVNVLIEESVHLATCKGLYQKWSWDCISGESVLFEKKGTAAMSDDDLIQEVIDGYKVVDSSTLTVSYKNDGLRCVNFNFKSK